MSSWWTPRSFHAPTMRVLVCLNLHTLLCNHSSSVLRRMWAQQQSSIFQKIEVLPRESTARYFHATTMRVLVRLNLRTSLRYYVPFLRRTSDQTMSVFTNTTLRPLWSYVRRDPNLYCEKKWVVAEFSWVTGSADFHTPRVTSCPSRYLNIQMLLLNLSWRRYRRLSSISIPFHRHRYIIVLRLIDSYSLSPPRTAWTYACTSCGTTTRVWDITNALTMSSLNHWNWRASQGTNKVVPY